MKPKYIGAVVFAVGFILGYNAFLVKRDAQLFKAYDRPVQQLK